MPDPDFNNDAPWQTQEENTGTQYINYGANQL